MQHISNNKFLAKTMQALLLAGVLAVSSAAWADRGGDGHGYGDDRGGRNDRGDQQMNRGNWGGDRDNGGYRQDNERGYDRGDRERYDNRRDYNRDNRVDYRFEDQQRIVVRDYYEDQFRRGRCPRGLMKRNGTCMPRGQARGWVVGQPLPASAVYYAVPQPVVVQLGMPPAGYQYVRVANDILLMAVGTHMVIDAITDFGRM